MSRPTRDYVCAALGVAIGVSCFAINNHVTKEWMDPLVAACTGGEYASHQERMLQQDIVPYEPLMGGGFVCIITQFLQALTKHYPGGMLTWSGVLLVSFPFGVAAGVESGRTGSKGPIRYHVAVGLLAQLLGVCLVIPALWIPSYIFGGSRDGAYHPQRPWHAVYTFAIPTLLTALIFALDSSSFAWRQCAGVLGGPLLAFLPLVYNYLSPTPTNVKEMQQNQKKAQESYVNALKLVGALSFVIYLCLVYIAVSAYGFHMVAIMNGLWQNAHPAVQFMTVDTTGFFLATLIYVYLQSPRQMLIMAMLVPLLGPGAAFSYVMVQKEPNYVVPKDDTKKQ